MEVLIRKLTLQSHIRGSGISFKIHPRSANILCLMFANDNLLFCKASTEACRNLKSTLDEFCNSSGQPVNFHKSPNSLFKKCPTINKNKSSETIQYAPQLLSRTLSCCVPQLFLSHQKWSKFNSYGNWTSYRPMGIQISIQSRDIHLNTIESRIYPPLYLRINPAPFQQCQVYGLNSSQIFLAPK